jgi:cytochrome c-type biogenesis protein CcmF
MTVLGNLVVILALVLAGGSALLYVREVLGHRNSATWAGFLVAGSSLFVAFASVLLLVLILTHDFTNGYVYSYSDRSLPLSYLISTFYAGQEGSFLFWTFCSAILALILRSYARRHDSEPWVMGTFMGIQTLLLLLVAVKTPFKSITDVIPGLPPTQVPADGRGLNPLLQNFWMVIHPPVLFLGFAAMAVPFSLAIAGLWKKDFTILPRQGFPWVLFATAVLGLGIMLGAYWAYGVLGWGGYWGWDPVENSSLIPWLTGVALLHTMLAQLRTAKYVRTNFVLAIVSFILVIYSTFLTRSGILGDASVHAFTDPGAGVYWLLLAIMALLIVVAGMLLVMRNGGLKVQHTDTMFLTRETSLGAGTIALILAAAVTLFGTSLPIFSTTRVEPSFYDQATLPIAVAMVLLIGFSLYTQWEAEDGKEILRRSMKWIGVSLGAGVILFVAGVHQATMLLLACSSIFAFFVNVEIGVKVAKGDPRFLGGKLAHVGIALFLLGVIATGKYASMEQIILPQGKPQQALGRTITYTGYTEQPDGKVAFHVAVERGGTSFTLSPVMFDAGQQGIMKNPDIASSLLNDFYLSPMSFEPHQGGVVDGDSYTIGKGQTVDIGDAKVTFLRFDMGAHSKEAMARGEGGMSFGSVLGIMKGTASEEVVALAHYRSNQPPTFDPVHSNLLGATLQMVGMNIGMQPMESKITVAVIRPGAPVQEQPDVLVVEASVKPFINLLWGGTVVMLVGFALAIVKRSKED